MLELFISAIIISIANVFLWWKVSDYKFNFKIYRGWVGLAFLIISLMINSIVQPILKIMIVMIITLFTIKIIYDCVLKEALILSVFTQIIYIVSELLVIIVVLIITNINSNQTLVEVFFGTIYANVTISLTVVLIVCIPFVKRLYRWLIHLVQNQKIYSIVMIIFTILVAATVILNFTFYRNNLVLLSIIGLMLLLAFLLFLVNNLIIRNSYFNVYSKYNSSLETLRSYEDMLDKYRVSNHESKNQLLMIRNLISKSKDSETEKYIDTLIKNEYQDDENIMGEAVKIPSGGLRALVYSKLLYMKNNNLSFSLHVDRKIRTIQLINLTENDNLDICKIIGVFLDNAIEETMNIKDGIISIELYLLDEKLNISISNRFVDEINLDKIDEIKYTTKGTGHGYGLTLVKEIISKNPKINNTRTINDDVFIQFLQVEI